MALHLASLRNRGLGSSKMACRRFALCLLSPRKINVRYSNKQPEPIAVKMYTARHTVLSIVAYGPV